MRRRGPHPHERPPPTPPRVLVVRGGNHRWVQHDRALLKALRLGGHTVTDLDLGRHPGVVAPPFEEDSSERSVDLASLAALTARQRPDVVLFAGHALRPTPASADALRARGPVLLGVIRVEEDKTDPDPRVLDGVLDLRGASTAVHPPRPGTRTYGQRVDGRLAATPATADGPPRTVLVSGYYGAGNRGDELLLRAVADALEAAAPEVHVVVAANDAAAVERLYGLAAFPRTDLTLAEERAAHATAVVLGPGGHWHDYSISTAGGLAGALRGTRVSPAHMAQLPLLVAGYGGRVLVHGMGVGPLADPAARAAVHLVGRLAHGVSVRDAASAELLTGLSEAWPAPVTVAADVAYSLPLPEATPDPGEWIAVSLRPWADDEAQRTRLLEEILDIARSRGLGVVGVPMQDTDVPALEEMARLAPDGIRVRILPADAPDEEVLGVLGAARAAVAMRLHAALLRHRLRGTAVGLAYDPKVTAHFAELGLGDDALPLEVEPARLRARLETALDAGRLSSQTEAAVAAPERHATQDARRLARDVADAPRRTLDPDWVRHTPPRR